MSFKRIVFLITSLAIASCSIAVLATDDFKAPPVGRTSAQPTAKSSSSTTAPSSISITKNTDSKLKTVDIQEKNSKEQYVNASIFKDNTFTVIVFPRFQPMEYYVEDKIVGIDIDLTKEIAKRLGLNFKIIEGEDWTKKTTFIKNKFNSQKANAFIGGFIKTPENELEFSEYYFSEPYIILEDKDGAVEYSIVSASKEISEEVDRILSEMKIDGTINKIIDKYSLSSGVKIYLPTPQNESSNNSKKQEYNSNIPAPPREFIANTMTERAKSIFGPGVEIIGKLTVTKEGYKYYLVQRLLLSKETIVDNMISGSMTREWALEMQKQLNGNSTKNKEVFEKYGYSDVQVEISLTTKDMDPLIVSIDGTATYNVLLDIFDTLLSK